MKALILTTAAIVLLASAASANLGSFGPMPRPTDSAWRELASRNSGYSSGSSSATYGYSSRSAYERALDRMTPAARRRAMDANAGMTPSRNAIGSARGGVCHNCD